MLRSNLTTQNTLPFPRFTLAQINTLFSRSSLFFSQKPMLRPILSKKHRVLLVNEFASLLQNVLMETHTNKTEADVHQSILAEKIIATFQSISVNHQVNRTIANFHDVLNDNNSIANDKLWTHPIYIYFTDGLENNLRKTVENFSNQLQKILLNSDLDKESFETKLLWLEHTYGAMFKDFINNAMANVLPDVKLAAKPMIADVEKVIRSHLKEFLETMRTPSMGLSSVERVHAEVSTINDYICRRYYEMFLISWFNVKSDKFAEIQEMPAIQALSLVNDENRLKLMEFLSITPEELDEKSNVRLNVPFKNLIKGMISSDAPAITNYLWRYLVIGIFQHDSLFKDDNHTFSTLQIFLSDIHELIERHKQSNIGEIFKDSATEKSIVNFIGQLVKLKQTASAQAIHTFLYFMKIFQKQPQPKGEVELPFIELFSNSLVEAFKLSDVIYTSQDQLVRESLALHLISTAFLKSSRFEIPFAAENYAKDFYEKEKFEDMYQQVLAHRNQFSFHQLSLNKTSRPITIPAKSPKISSIKGSRGRGVSLSSEALLSIKEVTPPVDAEKKGKQKGLPLQGSRSKTQSSPTLGSFFSKIFEVKDSKKEQEPIRKVGFDPSLKK